MLPVAKLDSDNIYQITLLLQACSRRFYSSEAQAEIARATRKKKRSESPQKHGYINF